VAQLGDLTGLRAALRAIAQTQLTQAASHNVGPEMGPDVGHDVSHLDRVWVTAQNLALRDGDVNLPVLLAACYLHDLVNLPKSAKNRAEASQLSAKHSQPILIDLGFSAAQITATCHAIEAHSFSANITPTTKEAAILRDADRLDALGAIGLARWFATAGTMGAAIGTALYDIDDPFAINRPLDDRRFALDHWRLKLGGLQRDMLTTGGQAMARERHNVMVAVLREFAIEIGAELPSDWV
jgi:uncharacterized protein